MIVYRLCNSAKLALIENGDLVNWVSLICHRGIRFFDQLLGGALARPPSLVTALH